MKNYDVRVTYAKEGTDDRHKSSGIVFYIEDVTKFQNKEYVKPVIIDNKLYFELSDTFQGRGNYIKLTNYSGRDKNSSVRRRIKKVSSDLDYIRQFAPYVGTHTLNFDYEKKQYYITPINVENNSLPLYMLPKKEYVHADRKVTEPKKEVNLSEQIAKTLVDAGMTDKITDDKGKVKEPTVSYRHATYQEPTQEKEKLLKDLTAKEFFNGMYKAFYSALNHTGIDKDLTVERIIKRVNELQAVNYWHEKGDCEKVVSLDDVLKILENY